jgi:hypothetical protein
MIKAKKNREKKTDLSNNFYERQSRRTSKQKNREKRQTELADQAN